MAIRTLNFLPEIFRTPANQKFLNATLDQLVSEPKFKKINGYIGRKFAPTFKVTDNYLPEPDLARQNYQLEPCVVVQDEAKNINFFNSYMDLIQQVQNYGGQVNNHTRMFDNEAYSFNGRVDFDKLVNFSQYYWLPGGPHAVDVFSGQIDDQGSYDVRHDATDNAYKFSGFGVIQNPDLVLARGGTYEFKVNQDSKFWIQTKPGISGTELGRTNVDTRAVYGVINNGLSNGTITFKVPQRSEQDFYVNMPVVRQADYATKLKFKDVDNQPLSQLIKNFGGIDGITSINDLHGKYLVFIDNDLADGSWEANGLYQFDPWSSRRSYENQPNVTDAFDRGAAIPQAQRTGIWQIQLIDTGEGDYVVQLLWDQDIPIYHRVAITAGLKYANKEFFKDEYRELLEVPLITANLDLLYYNDGSDQHYYGRIRLVDQAHYSINVDDEIVGHKNYVSPNGVIFTNGLKVRFGNLVLPTTYANQEYYVEGVGKAIRLVKVSHLITPELDYIGASIPYDIYGFSDGIFDESLNGPYIPDYLTSNRGSVDYNPWSRSNRWFHSDVIAKTAEYNKEVPVYDQTARAARPIIEFDPDIKLFNYGRYAKHNIDVLDFSVNDALNELEGELNSTDPTYFEKANFKDGMTVVFARDFDPTVRNKVWKVNVININKPRYKTNGDPVLDDSGNLIYDDGKYVLDSAGKLVLNADGIPTLLFRYLRIHLTHVENGTIEIHDSVAPKYGSVVNLLDNMPVKPTFTETTPPTLDQDLLITGHYTPDEIAINTHLWGAYNGRLAAYEEALRLWNSLLMSNNRQISPDDGLGLIPINGGVLPGGTMAIIVGYSFWYDGEKWVTGQRKETVNQTVMFDLIDNDLVSFGDQTKYKNSTFVGSKIFSYKPGTGANDTVLGFPISYRNFNNVGDIEYQNNFDTDTFTELVGVATISHSVNSGFIPMITDRTTLSKSNIWTTVSDPTRQSQIISALCDGLTSYFELDILPDQTTTVPNLAVYLNNRQLTDTEYEIVNVASRMALRVLASIKKNDKVDIQIYSANSVTELGYYEVPKNLDYNSLNQNFSSLTLGQFRNHLIAITNNTNKVVGQTPGYSNIRDLDIKTSSGNILQHSAPAIYSSLFLLNKELNYVDAITLAQKEYSKFKNRFLESFSTAVDAGVRDPRVAVDIILANLNMAKSSQQPWYYSDMVPYDQNKTLISYTVLDLEQTEYEIDKIFNDEECSNKAILVYVNNKQLVKGTEYEFSKVRQSVIMKTTLAYDDVLDIYVYHNTDGCYIPETPSKLGLYPKYTPAIYTDYSYAKPLKVIRGHDGSITPVFNDLRDDILLEYETRVYNNIKTHYDTEIFDVTSFIPGHFRKTEYSRSEFNLIVSRSFLSWIGNNRVEYAANQWVQSNNPWSWTYNGFIDKFDGTRLPGYWKGIYRYYYDTDAPNQRPWEMLGFSEMPDWWVATYGRAPYTGGNLVLWSDLEYGIIRHGVRAGTHQEYTRPGLSKCIPVTETGVLRSPDEFLITAINSHAIGNSFEIGDEGPVEAAWRRSSDYPYAVQQALALMKPARYFGLLANMRSYTKANELGQYLVSANNQRLTPRDFQINGDTTNTKAPVRSAGYLNWIVDYVTNNGANPYTTIHKYLDRLEVRLGYRAAGFADKSFLKVLAEQSSPSSTNESVVIPDENYIVHLHKSSSVSRLVYSAVIVEKTHTGYSVSGYNIKNPFFTIIPSEATSDSHQVVVDKAVGTVYHDYQQYLLNIPYGYQFTSREQVVDFLVSYQRYLEKLGFTFEEFDVNLQEVKNFELSIKEFLTWTQQGWGVGNIIVLSPIGNTVKLTTSSAVIDEIDNSPSGSKVLDIGFNVIRTNLFTAIRDGSEFSLSALQEISLGLVDLNMVQYEHALIFDNQTIFSDIIYKPELGNRQYRLKLVGNKTDDWAGQLNPPGFMFSNPTFKLWAAGQDYRKGDIVTHKSYVYTALQNVDAAETFNFALWRQLDSSKLVAGLLPNFAYGAQKFENMYDVDNQVQDTRINSYSNGLIGHRSRSYLSDLSLNATSQAKFYQGYIKDKGTRDAITALSSATFSNLSGNVQFNEEWAFRVGNYGAIESKQFIEVQLTEDSFVHTPQALTLLASGEYVPEPEVVGVYKEQLYKKPITFTPHIFKNRKSDSIYENDVQDAGYVNLNDVDATIFDIGNYTELNGLTSKVVSGFKIWVAKDEVQDWDVYRCDETPLRLLRLTSQLGIVKMTLDQSHDLNANDVIVVKGFAGNVDGFYRVIDPAIYSSNGMHDVASFTVSVMPELEAAMVKMPVIESSGAVFKLSSLRVNHLTDIVRYTPDHGWTVSDKVWVDTDVSNNQWAVYKKETPWEFNSGLPGTSDLDYAHYGQQVAISPDGGIIFATAPAEQSNNVKMLLKDEWGYFFESDGYSKNIRNDHVEGVTVGNTLTMTQELVAVSEESATKTIQSRVLVCQLSGAEVTSYNAVCDTTGIRIIGVHLVTGTGSGYTAAPTFNSSPVPHYTEIRNVGEFEIKTPVAGVGSGLTISVQGHMDGGVWVADSATMVTPGAGYLLPPKIEVIPSDNVNNGSGLKIEVIWESSNFGKAIVFSKDNNWMFVSAPNAFPLAKVECYKKAITGRFDLVQSIEYVNTVDFGFSVATNDNGSLLAIGAPLEEHNGIRNAGNVIIYKRDSNGVYQEQQTIAPAVGYPEGKLGYSLCLTGNGAELLVGAPGTFYEPQYKYGVVYRYVTTTAGYVLDQEIKKPYLGFNEMFGTTIVADPANNTILISSHGAYSISDTIFDVDSTVPMIFDDGSTTIFDSIPNAGGVYVYEQVSSPADKKYVYVQALGSAGLRLGDDFGRSVAAQNYSVVVGSPLNDRIIDLPGTVNDATYTDAGKVTLFTNVKKYSGWRAIRSRNDKVDVSKIGRMYLYNQKTQEVVTNLDFIDPIKGRILGIADQDINYKTAFDPAGYNRGTDTSVMMDESYHWGAEQVGQVWWDLDKIRYIDYEQDNLTYRIRNWGKMFPGSQVIVAEWVESSKKPSAYSGPGTPLYANDSAYVEHSANGAHTKYYFWVIDKESIDVSLTNRTLGVASIAKLISSPNQQAVPYAAVMRDNSIALFNTTGLLSASNTILHVDYQVIDTDNLIHNEYELIAENSGNTILPYKIVSKMVDSITGADKFGNIVPDFNLNLSERYGINVRPRQTMFASRLNATRNLVEYVNYVFNKHPIAEEFNLSNLYISELAPLAWDPVANKNISVATLGERAYLNVYQLIPGQCILVENDTTFFGQWSIYEVQPLTAWAASTTYVKGQVLFHESKAYKVLKSTLTTTALFNVKDFYALTTAEQDEYLFKLVRTQSYKTTDYWDKVDWFDASYNPTIKPTFTIAEDKDIARLKLKKNDIVWVKNNGNGQFVVYRVDGFSLPSSYKPDGTFLEIIKVYPTREAMISETVPLGVAVGQFVMIDGDNLYDVHLGKLFRYDGPSNLVNGVVTPWTYVYQLNPKDYSYKGVTGLVSVRDIDNRFFEVVKTYSTIDALLIDKRPRNIIEGQLALITTVDKSNADNGKIYMWAWNDVIKGYEYQFVVNTKNTLGLQVKKWQSIELPNANVQLKLVGVENGTIQLSDALWAHESNQIGFGNDSFDTVKYDLDPTKEFRIIIEAIKNDIFINSLDGEFNKLFFLLMNYILSEQRMVDWAFKSSFISVLHKLRKLDQFPNYIKDNQSFYQEYINEVKPYRTKIREYLINYEGIDNGRVAASDFDLPSYYDEDYQSWRSPNGEHARDALIVSSNDRYQDWLNNHTYSVDSVEVDYSGLGYTNDPVVYITGGGLPDGSPNHAKLQGVIDWYSGKLIKVIVVDPGKGYTSTPKITVTTSMWYNPVTEKYEAKTARCYPRLTNSSIRSFDTTIKFDRLTYSSDVTGWSPESAYEYIHAASVEQFESLKKHFASSGIPIESNASTLELYSVVANNGKAFKVLTPMSSGTAFDPSKYTLVKAWAAVTQYALDDVVSYNGFAYRVSGGPVLSTSANVVNGELTATIYTKIGAVVSTTWAANSAYAVNDLVTFDNAYIVQNTTLYSSPPFPYNPNAAEIVPLAEREKIVKGGRIKLLGTVTTGTNAITSIVISNADRATLTLWSALDSYSGKIEVSIYACGKDGNGNLEQVYLPPKSDFVLKSIDSSTQITIVAVKRVFDTATEKFITVEVPDLAVTSDGADGVSYDSVTFYITVPGLTPRVWGDVPSYEVGDLVYHTDMYAVNTPMTSGSFFNPTQYSQLADSDFTNAADRTLAMYAPTSRMLPKDVRQLFEGVEYPGNLVDGTSFITNPLIDTYIQSAFNDMALGTDARPEDINIAGGKFVDTYSSHAPEEFIPGMIYDTLEIRVFTIAPGTDPTDPLNPVMGYRMFKPMSVGDPTSFSTAITSRFGVTDPVTQVTTIKIETETRPQLFDSGETTFDSKTISKWELRRISAATTTTLAQNLYVGDTEIHVVDSTKLPVPSPTLAHPGVVYINGERITYYTVDHATNVLGQIRRGTWGTGAADVHMEESLVSDGSMDQALPGNALHTHWLRSGVGSIAFGDGLFSSYTGEWTEQAKFIGESLSYWPGPPLLSLDQLDPHINQTRFDEGRYLDKPFVGSAQQFDPRLVSQNAKAHPFAKDGEGFDSYDAG